MNDLKKIAADVNSWAQNEPNGNTATRLLALRDQLDALAAQSQEPVAKFVQSPYGNYPELKWRAGYSARIGDYVYAAPQPAQPEPAVPESFEKALMTFAHQHARAITPPIHPDWTTAEEYDEAKAEVLRLYALASAGAVKVPSDMRLVPQQFVSHVLALEHNWTRLTPVPPDFCTGPDSEHWFKIELYDECVADVQAAIMSFDAPPAQIDEAAEREAFERLYPAPDLYGRDYGAWLDQRFGWLACARHYGMLKEGE